jgi:hypothetical protein
MLAGSEIVPSELTNGFTGELVTAVIKASAKDELDPISMVPRTSECVAPCSAEMEFAG